MSDPNIITTIVVAAMTSGATRIVGAPLEGIAEHWKERVKARLDNTLDKAQMKAGDRDLEYSDRIAAKALNEAAWNDDELVADYLGGVLAASTRDDDAGAAIIAQIERLSAYQLRLHYVIYRELRRLRPSPVPNLYQSDEASRAGIRIPLVDLGPALAPVNLSSLPGAIAVLHREGLIADSWATGAETEEPPDSTMRFTMRVRPSGLGAELFLWGHGERPPMANRLFDPELAMTMLSDVPETPCATLQSTSIADALEAGPTEPHSTGTQPTETTGESPSEPLTAD